MECMVARFERHLVPASRGPWSQPQFVLALLDAVARVSGKSAKICFSAAAPGDLEWIDFRGQIKAEMIAQIAMRAAAPRDFANRTEAPRR